MNVLKPRLLLHKLKHIFQVKLLSSNTNENYLVWKRPENITYPTVWLKFLGKKYPDREPIEYKIQDVTEDLVEDVVTHFSRYLFVRMEVLAELGFIEDETSVMEQKDLWRLVLRQKMALVALVKDDETGKDKIAAASALFVKHKSDKNLFDPRRFQGSAMKKTWIMFKDVENQVNIFDKFNVDFYMVGMGFHVAPQYRGENLGVQLMKARNKLCEACGIRIDAASFSGPIAQSTASKAGFIKLGELEFENYRQNGKITFPKLKNTIALMAKQFY